MPSTEDEVDRSFNSSAGEFEITRLFGRAVRPWGIPTFVGLVGAGILAVVAGAALWLLTLLVAATAAILLLVDFLRRRVVAGSAGPPLWLLVLPLFVADIVAATFAIGYNGIEGGMWFALLMIATVAGNSLPKGPALAMGTFGGLLIPAVALITDHFDLEHAPAIFAASIYTFTMAGIASSQREAAVEQTNEAADARMEITEKHASEIEVMVESLGEGLLAGDPAGLVRIWNSALGEMTGIPPTAAIGMPIVEVLRLADPSGLLPAEAHPCVGHPAERLTLGSALSDPESDLFIERAGGGRIPVTISVAPLSPDGDGGCVAVVTDVTREREVSEMRDSLISMVSHELRGPLSMTLGYADLLAEGAVTGDDAKRSARAVRDSSLRLAALIDDLLSTSAIEGGTLKIEKRPVTAGEVSEAAMVVLAPEDRARIEVALDPAIEFEADPKRLAQAVGNLLTNALKYSPPDAAVLLTGQDGSDHVEICVEDHGAGIPQEDRAGLFVKFSRVGGAGRSGVPGTGLGLYISKKIVDAHGGSIEVSSQEGEGSSFCIRLPR